MFVGRKFGHSHSTLSNGKQIHIWLMVMPENVVYTANVHSIGKIIMHHWIWGILFSDKRHVGLQFRGPKETSRSKLGNVKGCPPVSSILNWREKTFLQRKTPKPIVTWSLHLSEISKNNFLVDPFRVVHWNCHHIKWHSCKKQGALLICVGSMTKWANKKPNNFLVTGRLHQQTHK